MINNEVCEQLWVRSVTHETKRGDKIMFTCKGFPRCPKRMQMCLDPESQDVHIHVSADSHNHTAIISRIRIDPRSKAKVLELLAVEVTQPLKLQKELGCWGYNQRFHACHEVCSLRHFFTCHMLSTCQKSC